MIVAIIVAITDVPCTLLYAWSAVSYNYVSKRWSEHHPYFSTQKHAYLLCILLSAFVVMYCMQFLRRYGNSITLDITQLLINLCAGIKLAHTANYKNKQCQLLLKICR